MKRLIDTARAMLGIGTKGLDLDKLDVGELRAQLAQCAARDDYLRPIAEAAQPFSARYKHVTAARAALRDKGVRLGNLLNAASVAAVLPKARAAAQADLARAQRAVDELADVLAADAEQHQRRVASLARLAEQRSASQRAAAADTAAAQAALETAVAGGAEDAVAAASARIVQAQQAERTTHDSASALAAQIAAIERAERQELDALADLQRRHDAAVAAVAAARAEVAAVALDEAMLAAIRAAWHCRHEGGDPGDRGAVLALGHSQHLRTMAGNVLDSFVRLDGERLRRFADSLVPKPAEALIDADPLKLSDEGPGNGDAAAGVTTLDPTGRIVHFGLAPRAPQQVDELTSRANGSQAA